MILFIDDEPGYMHYCILAFELEGYQVTVATRPSDALNMVRKHHDIEVIILDLMMPLDIDTLEDINGYTTGETLLNAIRKIKPKVPVIIHSIVSDKDRDFGPNVYFMPKSGRFSPLVDFVKTLTK